jgi:predicted RNase H-like HicB family nuclease
MDYIAYLHKDHKSDFGVSFPDFPGCITAGRTLEEARRRAAEALSFHIVGMIEDGEKIPNPSTVDDVAGDPALKGAIASLSLAEIGWPTAREKPISLGQQTVPNGQSSQSGSPEQLC